ncbi:MAG: FkbM family methyltransferase [Candidatus Acidiferrales bacterium]
MASVQFRGKQRLTNSLGSIASRFTPEADCNPVEGAHVTVSLSERIGRLMWTGCYEMELLFLLKEVLAPTMVFVDVGAQIGYFSIVAAALVAERGAVHAFEPDPVSYSRLTRNSHAYPWVKTYNCVVTNSIGEVTFFRSLVPGESGWGAIFNPDGERARISSRACTLDSWMSAEKITQIDILKIDVEGAECRVLEGAQSAVAKTRPIIWAEANAMCLSRDGKSVALLVQVLEGWGYLVQAVYDRRGHSFENLLAIPKERVDSLDSVRRANLNLRSLASSAP